jgi:hypothetical protein
MGDMVSVRDARRQLRERVNARAEAARVRGARDRRRLGKSAYIDGARDYVEHYTRYGWRYFTRDHCPPHLFDEVLAARQKISTGEIR